MALLQIKSLRHFSDNAVSHSLKHYLWSILLLQSMFTTKHSNPNYFFLSSMIMGKAIVAAAKVTAWQICFQLLPIYKREPLATTYTSLIQSVLALIFNSPWMDFYFVVLWIYLEVDRLWVKTWLLQLQKSLIQISTLGFSIPIKELRDLCNRKVLGSLIQQQLNLVF